MSTNWLNEGVWALFQLLWSIFDDGGRHIARNAAMRKRSRLIVAQLNCFACGAQ
jgi:hypothetical protein